MYSVSKLLVRAVDVWLVSHFGHFITGGGGLRWSTKYIYIYIYGFKCGLPLCLTCRREVLELAQNFDVLLSVHLSIILVTDQVNAQILVL